MLKIRTLCLVGLPLLAAGHLGCMRGVSYHMPMPQSLTIGTMKSQLATAPDPIDIRRGFASSPATVRRPTSVRQAFDPHAVETRFIAAAQ